METVVFKYELHDGISYIWNIWQRALPILSRPLQTFLATSSTHCQQGLWPIIEPNRHTMGCCVIIVIF